MSRQIRQFVHLDAVQVLLAVALAAFLFILAGQDRMWMNPQPPPGVPNYAWAGPMPSLTDPNGIMAAIARKKQEREMEQIREYVVEMCREHKTMSFADGRRVSGRRGCCAARRAPKGGSDYAQAGS